MDDRSGRRQCYRWPKVSSIGYILGNVKPSSLVCTGRMNLLRAMNIVETAVVFILACIFRQVVWMIEPKPMHIAFIIKYIIPTYLNKEKSYIILISEYNSS